VDYYATLPLFRQQSVEYCDAWWKMDWQEFETTRTWPNKGTIPTFFLEGLRVTTENLSQCSRCPDRDSNQASPEYKLRNLHQTKSVSFAWYRRALSESLAVPRRRVCGRLQNNANVNTCPERDSILWSLWWSAQDTLYSDSRYHMNGSLELYSVCNRWIYIDLL
jgi:hypothetical protein